MNFINKCLLLLLFVVGCATESYDVSDHTFKDGISKIKKASYRSKTTLISKWSDDVTPYLLLCDDFVPTRDAESAIKFWENLGYEFRSTRIGDPFTECIPTDAPFGAIRVKLPTSATAGILNGKLAVTSTVKYIDTNMLHSATITIHSFALNKRYTLEHEIGHALGWSHVETTGHIMNPKWANIGSKTTGIRQNCYSFSHD